MVHVKYTYKDGKKYGPYYYKTERVNGKIITTYLGSSIDDTRKRTFFLPFILSILLVAGVFLALFVQYRFSLTGNVALNVVGTYAPGDILGGSLALTFEEGELIPATSSVHIRLGDVEKTLPLYELLSASNVESLEGTYYAEGISLTGSGTGYGLTGTRTLFPEVSFELELVKSEKISSSEVSEDSVEDEGSSTLDNSNSSEFFSGESESSTDNAGESETLEESFVTSEQEEEEKTESDEVTKEQKEKQKEQDEGRKEESQDEEKSEKKSSENSENSNEVHSDDESSPGEDSGEDSSSASITGGVISDVAENNERISGSASRDKLFEYEVAAGYEARLVSDSVKGAEGDSVSDSVLLVEQNGRSVRVLSSYESSSKGFGSDFSGDTRYRLSIPLSLFDIVVANSTSLAVQVSFGSMLLFEEVGEITLVETPSLFENKTVDAFLLSNETNMSVVATNNSNLTLLSFTGAIQSIRLDENGSALFDLSPYFVGADSYLLSVSDEDLSFSFEEDILHLRAEHMFGGARMARVIAETNEGARVESNEFAILARSSNFSLITTRSKIVLGQPVRWVTNVSISNGSLVVLQLPAEAENVSFIAFDTPALVGAGAEDIAPSATDIPATLLTGQAIGRIIPVSSFGRWLAEWFGFTGKVTGDFEDEIDAPDSLEGTQSTYSSEDSSVELVLDEGAIHYTVEYYTPAPAIVETPYGRGKILTVAAPASLAYSEVVVVTNFSNELGIRDPSSIQVFWTTPSANITYGELKLQGEVSDESIVEEVSFEDTPIFEPALSDVVLNKSSSLAETSVPSLNEGVAAAGVSTESVITGAVISDGSALLPAEDNWETVRPAFEANDSSLLTLERVAVPFEVVDGDGDGYLDTLAWVAPHLSNQTYEIIVITKADHLNESREFVSDIYPFVKELDGNWSEPIPDQHYVRVMFETNLTSNRDITVYPRVVAGTPRIDIYEVNQTAVIASFATLANYQYNKVFLTGLEGMQDTFDLQIIGGSVEFDHIIDPVETTPPNISYVFPTPNNNSYQAHNSTIVNVSSQDGSLHYSFVDFDASNVLWMRMDDRNASNDTTDLSSWSNNGSRKNDPQNNSFGLFGSSLLFDGLNDYVLVKHSASLAFNASNWLTVSAWINRSGQNCNSAINSGTSNYCVIVSKSSISLNRGWELASNAGNLRFTFRNGTASSVDTSTSGGLSNNVWIHVAVVYNGTAIVHYLNGTAVKTTAYSAGWADSTSNLTISLRNPDVLTSNNNPFNGSIDEVLVFNRSLSAQEIGALYNATKTQYANNFTNLGLGSHTFAAYAVDISANRNQTGLFVVTIDTSNPVVTLVAPANGSAVTSASQSFNATFSDNAQLANATFYLWNSTPTLINTTVSGLSGTAGSVNLSVTLPYAGNFAWNYLATDNATNTAFNATNFTLTYSIGDSTPPTITIASPQARVYLYNELPLLVNVTLSEQGQTVLYTLTGGITNYSMSSTDGLTYNATNESIATGAYTLFIYANDTAGNRNDTSSVAFSIDAESISACSILNRSHVIFGLNQSIVTTISPCINVTASNVTIDGRNFNITHSAGGVTTLAINASGQDALSLRNLSIHGFATTVDIRSLSSLAPAGNITLVNSSVSSLKAFGYSNTSGGGQNGTGTNGGYVILRNSSLWSGSNVSLQGGNATGQTGSPGYGGSFEIHGNFVNFSNISFNFAVGSGVGVIKTDTISWFSINFSSGFDSIDTRYSGNSLARFTFANMSHGQITWLSYFDEFLLYPSIPQNFSSHVALGANLASLNSSAISAPSNFANITFYSIPVIPNARILRDGAHCSAPICANTSFLSGGGTVTFNVTSWSANYSIGNLPPVAIALAINSTSGSNQTEQTLNCFGTLLDLEGDLMNVTAYWYNFSQLHYTSDANNSYTNNTLRIFTLGAGNTTKNHNWSCGFRIFDGLSYRFVNTTYNLTILNTAPAVVLNSPADASTTTNRTPPFTFTVSDADIEPVRWEFNTTLIASSTCTDVGRNATGTLTPAEGGTAVAHFPSSDLRCFYDNLDYYNWTVRVNDSEVFSSWATPRRINITSLISVTLLNGTIEFGQLNYLDWNDTSDDSPSPFLLENDGNAFVNVTAISTQLWESKSSGSAYYQFKAANYTLENSSFLWASSATSYLSMPIEFAESASLFLAFLNYSDATDTAEIDLNVTVPPNEIGGVKRANVTFVASLTE